MQTMKAVRIHRYGGLEVLQYEEAPRPSPQAKEVLIRVRAAGVNPLDWKVRAGYATDWNLTFPLILGYDVAGVIEAVGAEVEHFTIGDEVYAAPDTGGYAEYVAVPASEVAHKPQTLDYVEAAALPIAALTAWQALFEAAQLAPGQTILIHGAAGGVGSMAVQLAKWRGARVIGTASAANLSFLRQLGADEVIDYTATRFETLVHDMDVVLDTVGGETLQRSWPVLKPGGIMVSITEPLSPEMAMAYGVQQREVIIDSLEGQAALAGLARLVDAGHLKPIVSTLLPLSEVRQAHILSEGRHLRGKIVLQVV